MSVDFTTTVDFPNDGRGMMDGLGPQLRRALLKLAIDLLPALREEVGQGMRASEEYASLVNGQLREEFGIADGQGAVESVIAAVQASVVVEQLPATLDVLGGIDIGIFRDDLSDALSASAAVYISHSMRKGTSLPIPWLKWLLLEGDGVVIEGFELLTGQSKRKISFRSSSRTGRAIMVRRDYVHRSRYHAARGRAGPSSWSVPPKFAGTARSNWITKVAEAIAPNVGNLLGKMLQRL